MKNTKYNHNFFTIKGVDISSLKSMWNFLHWHFTYSTLNSWNRLYSIANRVKLYDLDLEGDYSVAMNFLNQESYMTINMMIEDWEVDHPGYKAGFNGCNGGYLVLYNDKNNCSVLPSDLFDFDTYEDCLNHLHNYGESLSAYQHTLRVLTQLVRDFDELCNNLRDYVNNLSKMDFASMQLDTVVENYNMYYGADLKKLGYDYLKVKDGKVSITQIKNFTSLLGCLEDLLHGIDACAMHKDGDSVWLEETL